MKLTSRKQGSPQETVTALKIATVFVVIGGLWVVLSDQLLIQFVSTSSQLAHYQTLKGWVFVLGTATVLFILIRRDMTRVRQSEETFRSLVENSLTGISIIQDDAHVYQNPEQERILGALPRPVIMKNLARIHPNDVEKVRSFYEEISSGKSQKLDTEFRFYAEDNTSDTTEMRWVICRSNRIMYDGKEAILSNIMDVTRTRELERAVRVQDKMSSLGRVAAGMAHEIRNPLSGINIYLSTLKKIFYTGENLEKVGDILRQLFAASLKIESVIKRVMDFSKPTDPKVVLIDVNGPVSEAIDLVAVTLRKSGIDFAQDLHPDLPRCRLDGQMIEEVILNLITNAAEALKTVAREKRIVIRSFVSDERIRVVVADSGSGIPGDNKSRVFDPFYTTKPDGTGIGLSICQRIITDHGGTLTVGESEWGGASFELTIPIAEGNT